MLSRQRSVAWTGSFAAAMLLFSYTLYAQSTGTLVGQVSDASGGVIADKEVETKNGSEQEFDGRCILGRFLDHHEFGPGGRHALRLEQQISQVLVAAAAT